MYQLKYLKYFEPILACCKFDSIYIKRGFVRSTKLSLRVHVLIVPMGSIF